MDELSDPETYRIIGAAMKVHRTLGPGFLESVYQDALQLEFVKRGIPFLRETLVPVRYDGQLLPSHFRADFLCFSTILVELKASALIGPPDIAQLVNYLKATGLPFGLLISFGSTSLQVRRVGNDRRSQRLEL